MRFRLLIVSSLLLLHAPAISARINVVTLPDRSTVQLTIYNSVDLTLVKETRALTFGKGLNRLEFSWANTLIDPTSVEFRALTHADEVDVLDVSFPPRVPNTLEWRIQSEVAGEVQVEIRYFTSGISWTADYVLEAQRDEKSSTLAGYVRVANHSGEDYQNAQVRLVVGVIRLVEEIGRLARNGRAGPTTELLREEVLARSDLFFAFKDADARFQVANEARDGAKKMVKEGLSEYYLYSVEGGETIPNGWSKRLRSFQTAEVPLTSYYKFETEHYGNAVMRFYRFRNDKQSHLGEEPLPDGAVNAFRLVSNDGLYSFAGRSAAKYIPVDEQAELELGDDPEVMIRPTLMNWIKTDLRFDRHGNVEGWTIKETWQIETQNSKDLAVTIDIRRNFAGDWTLATQAPFEKVDAGKVKFVFSLEPGARKILTYELTTRFGSNVSR